MATVDGYTKAHMDEIVDGVIEDANVVGGDLILTKHSGATVNAGSVIGPQGPDGNGFVICTNSTRPSSPTEGAVIYETDTNRVFIWNGAIWKFLWAGNHEDEVDFEIAIGGDSDATTLGTWPTGFHTDIVVPSWATKFKGYALIGQAQQFNAVGNTQVEFAIGAIVITHKRIRWAVNDVPDSGEQDIMLPGTADVSSIAGDTVSLRVTGERVSGTGLLRADSESVCYLEGKFTDP